MIESGISDLNIDMSYSWLIGDTTTDVQTAKNAGINSILVKTGYSGLDENLIFYQISKYLIYILLQFL